MATRLDHQIEELEHIVETRLGLCTVTSNGVPCILPANHQPAEWHRFMVHTAPARGGASRGGDYGKSDRRRNEYR